jgi:hypothetical protein
VETGRRRFPGLATVPDVVAQLNNPDLDVDERGAPKGYCRKWL